MRKLLLLCLLFGTIANAQAPTEITLEQCRQWAIEVSPLTLQKELVKQLKDANISVTNTSWVPKVDVNAQATYQSDVTQIPISMPGFSVEPLSKDQYKATLDLAQTVFDGRATFHQKALQVALSEVEGQKIEVDIQKLREQVNALFLSIFYVDESLKVIDLTKSDIENNLSRVRSLVANGAALKSDIDVLEAGLLKIHQQRIEMEASRKAGIQSLSLFVGRTIAYNSTFVRPQIDAVDTNEPSNRPELRLFDLQKASLQSQSNLTFSKNMPKLSAFASGGYGLPTYNMLKNEFGWMYIVGMRLNVPLSNFYTTGKERKVISLQQDIVNKQRDNFALNNKVQINQQLIEIEKFEQLIEKDGEIVQRRTAIKQASAQQLANGVITSTDYLIELNAEAQALLSQKLHEVQLVQSKINYQSLLGK